MHLDLKPGNILLVGEDPPRLIITDFGCAEWSDYSYNHTKGTFGYLAPEILTLKQREQHPTSDYKVLESQGVC